MARMADATARTRRVREADASSISASATFFFLSSIPASVSVRALLLAALLLLPAAAASLPPVGLCTQFFCAHARDVDGDGAYDWANFAGSLDPAATLNANYNASKLSAHADGGTEETWEPYHVATLLVYVDLAPAGGVSEAWILLDAREGNEETGEKSVLASQLLHARDTNGDGIPETVETVPALP